MYSYEPLNATQISENMTHLHGWHVEDNILTKLFKFDSYQDGLDFATSVGKVADELNHHPDIHIGYQQVRISTTTHDTGGLTEFDFELANRIEKLN